MPTHLSKKCIKPNVSYLLDPITGRFDNFKVAGRNNGAGHLNQTLKNAFKFPLDDPYFNFCCWRYDALIFVFLILTIPLFLSSSYTPIGVLSLPIDPPAIPWLHKLQHPSGTGGNNVKPQTPILPDFSGRTSEYIQQFLILFMHARRGKVDLIVYQFQLFLTRLAILVLVTQPSQVVQWWAITFIALNFRSCQSRRRKSYINQNIPSSLTW